MTKKTAWIGAVDGKASGILNQGANSVCAVLPDIGNPAISDQVSGNNVVAAPLVNHLERARPHAPMGLIPNNSGASF